MVIYEEDPLTVSVVYVNPNYQSDACISSGAFPVFDFRFEKIVIFDKYHLES